MENVRNNNDRISMGVVDAPPVETVTPAMIENKPPENLKKSPKDIFNKMMSLTYMQEDCKLPSRGRYYPEGHPFHNVEVISVNYMTSKEQDLLSTKSVWQENKIFDRLLRALITDPVEPSTLLSGDRMAIFATSRITLNHLYETPSMCPICRSVSTQQFNLAKALSDAYAELDRKEANLKPFEEGLVSSISGTDRFITKLPVMGCFAEFRLLYGIHEEFIMKNQMAVEANIANAKTVEEKLSITEQETTDLLKSMVVALFFDDTERVEEPGMLSKILGHLPAKDTLHLENMYRYVAPEIRLREMKTCPKCLQTNYWSIPYTDFFRAR